MDYDPALRLEGVILNRVGGEAHARWLTEAVAGSGVATRVLGGIPEARPASLRCVPRRDVRPLLRCAPLRSVAVGGAGRLRGLEGCAAHGALACAARGAGRGAGRAPGRCGGARRQGDRPAAPAQHLPQCRTRSLCPFEAG